MSLHKQNDWSFYNTPEDFQKFIDEKGYQTVVDLKNEFGGLYERLRHLKLTKQVKFPKGNKRDWSFYDSQDKVQKFIDDHKNIKTKKDLKKSYKGLYEKSYKNGWLPKLIFKESRINWNETDLKTKEDFKKFLKDNNITNRGQLYSAGFSRLYVILERRNLLNELLPLLPKNDWSSYNTLDDFQRFIDENNIQNRKELSDLYPGINWRIKKFLKGKTNSLKFPNKRKSSLEIRVERFLKNNNIKFEEQKIFSDLGKLRFDFFLPDYNIILEPGGEQHFIPIDKWGGEQSFKQYLEHDNKKYDYCINNNYDILYYFSFKPEYKEEIEQILKTKGYFGRTWFLDFNEFTNKILELIKNKKEGLN